MARFVSGDVVVVPFPFTDFSSTKVRPAVVLTSLTRGDVILCQITSKKPGIRNQFLSHLQTSNSRGCHATVLPSRIGS